MSQHIDPAFTQQEAQERGLKYFFTGKECRNGHLSVRKAADGACLECHRESNRKANRKYRTKESKKPLFSAQAKRHREKHLAVVQARDRVKYYQKRLDKALNELSALTITSTN